MSSTFLAQLMPVSFNFAPRGWAACNGQILPINQNQALFSLLGTTFGGNGQTTFALPNLQGQIPIGQGNGYTMGQLGGEVAHTLTISETPQHVHQIMATSAAGSQPVPAGGVPASSPMYIASPPDPAAGALSPQTIGIVGGSQPHLNMQPYLVINWVIALQGIFPSRN